MNEFLDSEAVFKTLGDFWYSHYDNKDQIRDLVYALVELQKQLAEDTTCLEKSVSRHTIEPFRKVLWYPVHILESEFINNAKRYVNYGETSIVGDGVTYGVVTHQRFTVPVPDEVVEIGAVHDRIVNPELTIDKPGIKNHKIEIDINLFNLDSVYIETVYNEQGEAVDREAVLWLADLLVDREDLYNLFGYALGIKLNSSERYKALINALFNALINGPSKAALSECMSAITGIPVVKTDREQVIKIEGNSVITDKNEYTFSPNDTILVTVGDILSRGDTLTSGLVIKDRPDDIRGLQLVPPMTYLGMIGNLYIPNEDTLLTIESASDKTLVNFPVYGNASDITRFNNAVWNQGIEDCQEITDACEIAKIKKILQTPNKPDESGSQDDEMFLNAGMTTWIRTRRLN